MTYCSVVGVYFECWWAVICISASCPAGELVSVSLNEVVRLHCPAASRLSQQLWERPNSRLSSDLYLHLGDGSLSFVATPATLGHYLCLSTENGYQQTMAIYHVKQRSSPMAPTSYTRPQTHPIPTTQTVARPGPRMHTSGGTWPKRTAIKQGETEPTLSSRGTQVTPKQLSRNVTMWTQKSGRKEEEFSDGEPQLWARGPCYPKELVVVSVLLVLCLSLLITLLLYVFRQHCRRRTAPQAGTPTRDSDRRTPVEQEAFRENQFLSKRNGQAPHSGQASGLVCNGALTDSNGHLPNTPIWTVSVILSVTGGTRSEGGPSQVPGLSLVPVGGSVCTANHKVQTLWTRPD